MKKISFILVVLCCPVMVICQDITGLWAGTIKNDSTGLTHSYEIGIRKIKGKYTGFTHTWFSIGDKRYYGLKKVHVRIANDGKVIVVDDELIANNYPVSPNKNVRQLNVLSLSGSEENPTLSGPFVTNRTKEFLPLSGEITLVRRKDVAQSDLVVYLQKAGFATNDWSFMQAGTEPVLARSGNEK
ncbi:MAG: hypothetical protein ABIT96_13525 [Ferruginibacter sp.]